MMFWKGPINHDQKNRIFEGSILSGCYVTGEKIHILNEVKRLAASDLHIQSNKLQ